MPRDPLPDLALQDRAQPDSGLPDRAPRVGASRRPRPHRGRPHAWGSRSWGWRVLGMLVVSGGLLGCGNDTTGPSLVLPTQAFYRLALDKHAINMAVVAPYDTVRLTAQVLNGAGLPLVTAQHVTYTPLDSNLTVDSTGLITARYTTPQTQVTASLTVNGVTQSDVVFIQITPTALAAPLATFSIQPRPDGLDSAKTYANCYAGCLALNTNSGNALASIPVYATIATGSPATDTICDVNACSVLVSWRSSNPSVASIDALSGAVSTGNLPGIVTFFADTWAYGVHQQDSLRFVVGYPTNQVNFSLDFHGCSGGQPFCFPMAAETVGVGAFVLGQSDFNPGPDTVQLFLDGPTSGFKVRSIPPGEQLSQGWILPSTPGTHIITTLPAGPQMQIVESAGPCLQGKEPTCQ